jgi:hypothetical protein
MICHDHEQYPAVLDYLEANQEILEKTGHKQALTRIANVKKNIS